MGKQEKIILITVLAVFILLNVSSFVFAQKELEVTYPEVSGARPENVTYSLPEYVKYVFNFALAMSGVVVFIVLIYSGIKYMTSAGRPDKKRDARNSITAAILGLLLLTFSYLILTTINPQLVFLSIPERVVLPPQSIIEIKPEEKELLAYTEISTGGVMAELFSEDRLKDLKDVVQKTQDKAKEVRDLSDELKALTDKCQCLRCDKGSCVGGITLTCISPCTDNCECSGDPCGSDRAAIDQKMEQLEKAISDSETDKGLDYWKKRLDVVVNGSAKEDVLGFREVYQDLKTAEILIKNCPLSLNEKGHSQVLLTYRDFWQYREALEENEEIRGVSPAYAFTYIPSNNPYYLANFYCTETLYSIPETSIGEADTGQIDIPASGGGDYLLCGTEIAIGETIDNAEELARRMLVELDNISDSIPDQIKAAQDLMKLPEQCVSDGCSNKMIDTWDCCCHIIVCTKDGCAPVCVGRCCKSCYCAFCSGNACPYEQINSAVSQIRSIYSGIELSASKIKNFIEEKNIEDKFKISKLFEALNVAQNQLGACYNTKEARRKALSGGEKVFWKELYSCSQLKEFTGWGVRFYDERDRRITECYGIDQGEGLMDNFLCCNAELF